MTGTQTEVSQNQRSESIGKLPDINRKWPKINRKWFEINRKLTLVNRKWTEINRKWQRVKRNEPKLEYARQQPGFRLAAHWRFRKLSGDIRLVNFHLTFHTSGWVLNSFGMTLHFKSKIEFSSGCFASLPVDFRSIPIGFRLILSTSDWHSFCSRPLDFRSLTVISGYCRPLWVDFRALSVNFRKFSINFTSLPVEFRWYIICHSRLISERFRLISKRFRLISGHFRLIFGYFRPLPVCFRSASFRFPVIPVGLVMTSGPTFMDDILPAA